MSRVKLPSVVDAVEFRREQYLLTQSQWAKVIGTSASHYSEFTHGKRPLTLSQAAKCFEYGVPAECLFQNHGDKDYRDIKKSLMAAAKGGV